MEKKLKKLFDFQRFEPSASVSALISETESRYAVELSDDDLTLVNAAGDSSVLLAALLSSDSEEPQL